MGSRGLPAETSRLTLNLKGYTSPASPLKECGKGRQGVLAAVLRSLMGKMYSPTKKIIIPFVLQQEKPHCETTS
jgi:hypothetical protein